MALCIDAAADLTVTQAHEVDQLVPVNVVRREIVQSRILQNGRYPMQPRSTWCMGPHARTVKSGVRRQREVLIRPVSLRQNRFDLVPDLNRNRVRTWPTYASGEFRDYLFRLDTALPVHTDLCEKRNLVGSPVNGEEPAIAIARLSRLRNPALHPHSKKQVHHIVNQAATGRGVIDPSL
jgi:hypothetical protein